MKVSGRQIEGFLAAPDPAVRAVLLYGPDGGLVRERADRLVRGATGDPGDPFRVAELTPGEVESEPSRLFDEAAAIAMTGGRRAVRMRGLGDPLADILGRFLDDPPGDALVVLEAGDLPPRSRLRKLFEGAGQGAALPCYRDEARDLAALIDDMAGQAGYRVSREAREYLSANLGGDRLLTRRELEKLLLYMGPGNEGGGGEIGLAEAQACVGDTAERNLDDMAFALGAGNLAETERSLSRALQEGASWVAPLRAAARHLQRLHQVAGALRGGARPESAMAALRPPVFWKQRESFQRQAASWSTAQLAAALTRLTETELEGKRGTVPGETLASQTLLAIAARAARAQRR